MGNKKKIMSSATSQLLDFVKMCNDFALIKRNKIKDDLSRETDAEHTYQVAMVSWYVNSAYGLRLNEEKILKYALVHDIPEVRAGDVSSIHKHRDPTLRARQSRNEAKAAQNIQKDFGEFKDFLSIYEKYESQDDEEAKLVYAIDKFLAFINMYLMKNDHYCHDEKCTKEEYVAERLLRLKEQPLIQKIFLELVPIVDQAGIFYKPSKRG